MHRLCLIAETGQLCGVARHEADTGRVLRAVQIVSVGSYGDPCRGCRHQPICNSASFRSGHGGSGTRFETVNAAFVYLPFAASNLLLYHSFHLTGGHQTIRVRVRVQPRKRHLRRSRLQHWQPSWPLKRQPRRGLRRLLLLPLLSLRHRLKAIKQTVRASLT